MQPEDILDSLLTFNKPTIGDHFMFYDNGVHWIRITEDIDLRFEAGQMIWARTLMTMPDAYAV